MNTFGLSPTDLSPQDLLALAESCHNVNRAYVLATAAPAPLESQDPATLPWEELDKAGRDVVLEGVVFHVKELCQGQITRSRLRELAGDVLDGKLSGKSYASCPYANLLRANDASLSLPLLSTFTPFKYVYSSYRDGTDTGGYSQLEVAYTVRGNVTDGMEPYRLLYTLLLCHARYQYAKGCEIGCIGLDMPAVPATSSRVFEATIPLIPAPCRA